MNKIGTNRSEISDWSVETQSSAIFARPSPPSALGFAARPTGGLVARLWSLLLHNYIDSPHLYVASLRCYAEQSDPVATYELHVT